KTWTFKIKPGIYFADDPAFKGKKRELTAADYVYSWKRIIDPKMRSNNIQVFDGKIVGADPVVSAAKENGKFDYDAPMEGLQTIGRIEISVIEESNPRLLAFQKGELDYLTVPSDLVANVVGPDNKLKPELAKQGIVLARGVQPAISYTYFNMDDPVVGGYTKEKIALRRAVSMAYNVDEEIRVLRQGQAARATQPIP